MRLSKTWYWIITGFVLVALVSGRIPLASALIARFLIPILIVLFIAKMFGHKLKQLMGMNGPEGNAPTIKICPKCGKQISGLHVCLKSSR